MLARCCGCSPLKSCRFSWSGLARAICEMGHNLYDYDVRCGSWLCENAQTLNRDRRSYSSKTALGLQFESAFNLEIELKNVILDAFRLFAFLHSRVRRVILTVRRSLPLYLNRRTIPEPLGTSHLCQAATKDFGETWVKCVRS